MASTWAFEAQGPGSIPGGGAIAVPPLATGGGAIARKVRSRLIPR